MKSQEIRVAFKALPIKKQKQLLSQLSLEYMYIAGINAALHPNVDHDTFVVSYFDSIKAFTEGYNHGVQIKKK